VLILVAEGLENASVGRRLGISEGTVKVHLGRTYQKLGACDRANAVYIACVSGILTDPDEPEAASVDGPLTEEELAVLRCAANGRTNEETSDELEVSYHVVVGRHASIRRKLDAHDRAHSVGLALAAGLLQPREIITTTPLRSAA
jgi:DNA-binding NarL/FixJ family response regulator